MYDQLHPWPVLKSLGHKKLRLLHLKQALAFEQLQPCAKPLLLQPNLNLHQQTFQDSSLTALDRNHLNHNRAEDLERR